MSAFCLLAGFHFSAASPFGRRDVNPRLRFGLTNCVARKNGNAPPFFLHLDALPITILLLVHLSAPGDAVIQLKELVQRAEGGERHHDVALANLGCACGLPGTESLDIPAGLKTVDSWTERVAAETNRLAYLFRERPAAYEYSRPKFQMMVLLTVLQRDLGVIADPQLNDLSDHAFFSRSEHVFLHGVLAAGAGTCSSLPPAYAAVGRRLGYPLKLVSTCRHVFLRWDGGSGERFNIECTSPGLVAHPDEYYLRWPRPLPAEQSRRYHALQSLTPVQEIASFLANRGHVWFEHRQYKHASNSYAQACELDPENWACSDSLIEAMNAWDRELQSLLMPGFPSLTIARPPRMYPHIPEDLESGLFHMMTKENLLLDPPLKARWWDPLRRDRSSKPADLPIHISVRFQCDSVGPPEVTFHDTLPEWFDPRHAMRG